MVKVTQPFDHFEIERGGIVTDVDELKNQGEVGRLLEVGFDQVAPALSFLLADLGVAVARNVDEVELIVDEEVVDEPGLARAAGGFRETLAVEDFVEDAGLPHVGASCEDEVGNGSL